MVLKLNERYVVDADGNRVAVILDMPEWRRVLEALEELDDIEAFDAAIAADEEGIPLEEALAAIERQRPRQ